MSPTVIRMPAWVDRFDRAVDEAWQPLREIPVVDRALYLASAAGEFSLVWHGLNVLRVLRGRADRHEALRTAVLIGVESAVVNQGLKRVFRRERPERDRAADRYRLRQPSTTSFPSGHASSAVVAVSLLSPADPLASVYRVVGAAVAGSRVHVRVHHASDVIAGAAVGAVLVAGFARLWPRRWRR